MKVNTSTSTSTGYWTCVGPVRNECGLQHADETSAWECCATDDHAVRLAHGDAAYSDRFPVRRELFGR